MRERGQRTRAKGSETDRGAASGADADCARGQRTRATGSETDRGANADADADCAREGSGRARRGPGHFGAAPKTRTRAPARYGFAIDFVGDEGRVADYASAAPADAVAALDYGLAEPRPAPAAFAPNDRVAGMLEAVPDGFEAPPRPKARGLFGFSPIDAVASAALGPDAAPAYTEALGWPADGETRKRFGLDVLAPASGVASFFDIDESLEAGDWEDDLAADALTSPNAVEGDAVVFVTAKFCNACRRMDPHVKRMERSWKGLRFYRVDSTSDRTFAAAAGVDSTPTFLLYREGVRVATVGTASPTQLRSEIVDAFPLLVPKR